MVMERGVARRVTGFVHLTDGPLRAPATPARLPEEGTSLRMEPAGRAFVGRSTAAAVHGTPPSFRFPASPARMTPPPPAPGRPDSAEATPLAALKRPLYREPVNRWIRTLLRPLAPWLPEACLLPVTGEITVEAAPDVHLRLAANPTSYVAKMLFWRGVQGFEYEVVRVFLHLARSARVVLDVGANIGYYALLAAAVNPAVAVVAFEPQPGIFRYLRRNIALNGFEGRITPEPLALAEEPGTATFYASYNTNFPFVADHLGGRSGFDADHAARLGRSLAFPVTVDTLDAYADRHLHAPIDLLKLDTEGTEDRVLAGAKRVLEEHRPIVFCEVLPGRIEDALESIFRRHGYRLFRAEAGGLTEVERLRHLPGTSNDHVMARPEAVPRLHPFLTAASGPAA
ncbi:hypothetical protein AWN76_007325 [Rhodothermaceae bacterium RA]|nr:hypothetical protein AWN76_007325 [Rhodothermaceae bacterium RA]